jgi:hypothetical protein
MANTTPEEKKATTPVQGAGGAAETTEPATGADLTQESQEIPGYIAELLKSNEEVIKSNQLVIDGINQFKESASDMIREIVTAGQSGTAAKGAAPEPVEIDPKAKYAVAKDMSFRDSKDFNKVYKSGDDVSDFEEARLANLVQSGHVVKKSK